MNAKTNPATAEAPANDLELCSSRVFEVSPERLFAAWTNPQRLAQWWGPQGFTNTFEKCDIRPGGEWRFVMHGPDGTDYKNESKFVEIEPSQRIVIQHTSNPHFILTATFEDLGGKTNLIWHMAFETAEICAAVKRYAADANEQNFDRLAENVAQ